MTRLALHLYQSPMDHDGGLVRVARSLADRYPELEVRLVGLRVDDRCGLVNVSKNLWIDRVGSPASKRETIRSRITKVGGWYRSVFRRYRDEQLAAVSVHSVWALPLGYRLARRAHVPLVYNAQELETRTPTMTGLKWLAAAGIEAWYIRKSALVSVVNDQIATWYQNRYRIRRPVVVYNYPSAHAQEFAARDLRSELGIREEELLFIHTGNITGGRNIDLILRTFENQERHHVVFLGNGPLLPMVGEAVSRSRFIHHLPPVSVDEVVSVVKGADVALSLIETSALSYAWSSPNKLFEALAAGVPPLCTDLPEARNRLGDLAETFILEDPVNELEPFLARIERGDALRYRKHLATIPTWEQGVAELIESYNRLLSEQCK